MPKLAWLNGFRSDYPLNSSSLEWLDFGPRLAADPVRRFLVRHASSSIPVVQAFYEPRGMNLSRDAKYQFNIVDHVLPIPGLRGTSTDAVWIGFSCSRAQPFLLLATAIRWALETTSSAVRCWRRNEFRVASGHPVLDVAAECRVSICELSSPTWK